jgi:hypothetical protein
LATILADTGRIALDVAGIERRLVERWREQQDDSRLGLDKLRLHGRHGERRPRRIAGARDHAP